ncbi:hypothetical protein M3Y98_00328800 [Aphelenchoides besseyi]|nr:hypothetical protein M3Y98_00328800 [Aphelenchoides besseyi]KAI6201496.1 hypothetical protein M3Y96_00848100 [Aphelenchoides besseyi]
MAFIVPVMKKDYNLYNSHKSPVNTRSRRSNSTPVKITLPAEQMVPSRRSTTKTTVDHTRSVPVPAVVCRRDSNRRRISVRHLSSTDSTESNSTDDSRRRVRFGICVEIAYDNSDNEIELEKPKQKSVDTTTCKQEPSEQKFRSLSCSDVNERNKHKRQLFNMTTLLKIAKHCSPSN